MRFHGQLAAALLGLREHPCNPGAPEVERRGDTLRLFSIVVDGRGSSR
jgi:hypothetical protein